MFEIVVGFLVDHPSPTVLRGYKKKKRRSDAGEGALSWFNEIFALTALCFLVSEETLRDVSRWTNKKVWFHCTLGDTVNANKRLHFFFHAFFFRTKGFMKTT